MKARLRLFRAAILCVLCAAMSGCGGEESAADEATPAAEKPLSPRELAESRAAMLRSYRRFLDQPDQIIEAELGECRSAIVEELRRQHLNVMLSDNPGRTIRDMKRNAQEEIERLKNDPTAPGMDVVMERVNLCTFDRVLSKRRVQQASAFCEFQDGKYVQHGIGTLTEVPEGLAYTCDGYGL